MSLRRAATGQPRLDELTARHPTFAHMAAVPRSVIEQEATGLLAGFTSMHDIWVVAHPIPDYLPFDYVQVCAPNSLQDVAPGQVKIMHVTPSGHHEVMTRPTDQTIPLFWRFMIEKFGVYPSMRTAADE